VPEQLNVRFGKSPVGGGKFRISRDCLFEELHRPRVIISKLVVVAVRVRYFHQGTGPYVALECGTIVSRPAGELRTFAWRKLRAQLIGDSLCDLALKREHVGYIAIISLSPGMHVFPGID
jgi:hypothetical protein